MPSFYSSPCPPGSRSPQPSPPAPARWKVPGSRRCRTQERDTHLSPRSRDCHRQPFRVYAAPGAAPHCPPAPAAAAAEKRNSLGSEGGGPRAAQKRNRTHHPPQPPLDRRVPPGRCAPPGGGAHLQPLRGARGALKPIPGPRTRIPGSWKGNAGPRLAESELRCGAREASLGTAALEVALNPGSPLMPGLPKRYPDNWVS